MPQVGIALGTNLGDRLTNLQAARERLRQLHHAHEPMKCAATYQTEPQFCPPGSPFFYNSVVEITYLGCPFELLRLTQQLEKSLGRTGSLQRNTPRIIDIDLLYFDDQSIDTEELVLPHPRLVERRFVLQPLAEIRPNWVPPGQNNSVSTLLAKLCRDQPPLRRIVNA